MVRPESFKIKGSQTLAVFKCYCGFPGHCHCTKLIFHFTESKELQVEMELNWIFWWFSWTNSQATCKWIKKHNIWLKYCIKNIMYDNKCILTKQFTQKITSFRSFQLVSSSEHIWRNLAVHYLLANGSSAVYGWEERPNNNPTPEHSLTSCEAN